METKKTEVTSTTFVKKNTNPDPMTGEHGAHPLGVGTGATGGGIAGAVIGGAVGGPIGAGVGAVVGAVSGSLAGKSAAEAINPTNEHAFWRMEFKKRAYFTEGTPYEQYGPAFQYGWESYATHKGKTFKDVELQLAQGWESHRKQSQLSWPYVKDATRDAWQHVNKAACGDSFGGM